MFARVSKILAAVAVLMLAGAAAAAVPDDGYKVVRTYPHDTGAFTEGLFYRDGYLYESTGLNGRSTIRKEKLETGQVVLERAIPSQYFGEGIVAWGDKLVELTWQNHVGFIYDLASFAPKGEFHYPGEGWALTRDANRIIMSDGTANIRFLDPKTLKETGRIRVTMDGQPVDQLNELEWVKGEIWANVWQTNFIVRIDPKTGRILGRIDLTGLLGPFDFVPGQTDVLNGIAYDAKGDRLFVTGKNWPKIFEIKLVRKGRR
jgi:glutamine cyclotransferase